jgi:hypothetical protein
MGSRSLVAEEGEAVTHGSLAQRGWRPKALAAVA